MRKISLMLLFYLIWTGPIDLQAQKSATIQGVLKGFASTVPLEEYSDLQRILPESYNTKVVVEKDNSFKLTIPLTEPNYFRFGRNKLYLSPGDKLKVYLDFNASALATFKGKGSEANDYLKTTLFPQGGSYLKTGDNIKPSPEETYQYIVNEASKRRMQLEALTKVSDEFKRLERARILGDMLRSFETVDIYGKNSSRIPAASRADYLKRFKEISKNLSDSISSILTDPAYLKVEVCRYLIHRFNIMENNDPAAIQYFNDYKKSLTLAVKDFPSVKDKSQLPEFKLKVDSIQTEHFRNALYKLIEEKYRF